MDFSKFTIYYSSYYMTLLLLFLPWLFTYNNTSIPTTAVHCFNFHHYLLPKPKRKWIVTSSFASKATTTQQFRSVQSRCLPRQQQQWHSVVRQHANDHDENNDDVETTMETSPISLDTTILPFTSSSTTTTSSSSPSPTPPHMPLQSRRLFLGAATTTATLLHVVTASSNSAWAGNAEVDRASGLLYVPKSQMLRGGGSDVTRGVPLRQLSSSSTSSSSSSRTGRRLQPTQQLQNVYEPRFIAYLTRFLFNFDPAARGWWLDNKLEEYTWESTETGSSSSSSSNSGATSSSTNPANDPTNSKNNNINNNNRYNSNNRNDNNNNSNDLRQIKFAEFCESVEVGLADYFVGPYGSYSSVRAAMAGIAATNPARSLQPSKNKAKSIENFFSSMMKVWNQDDSNSKKTSTTLVAGATSKKSTTSTLSNRELELAKQGILNLYALLKARYTSISAKRQLAILFSLISSPDLQPTTEIQALIGEADNATITKLHLDIPKTRSSVLPEPIVARTSSRRGGGYTVDEAPVIEIDPPPALGDDYLPAKATAIMQPTSRILRIKVTDKGEGYTQPPDVHVIGRCRRACEACAILDRQGRVAEVVVLDPGNGYSGSSLLIKIDPPKAEKSRGKNKGANNKRTRSQGRTARATAVLEYAIVGIDLVEGGNGYVSSEPPRVRIRPPDQDPDWFIAVQEAPERRLRQSLAAENDFKIQAKVTEMRTCTPSGNVVFSSMTGDDDSSTPPSFPQVDAAMIDLLQRDPLELLPSSVRPQLIPMYSTPGGVTSYQYVIPSLPSVPPYTVPPSPRYRAFDPIFGGVGTVPVTKGALSLSASEYARLALSGALCTVIVRTVLNPLELIKTKQQLGNDLELNEYCVQQTVQKNGEPTQMPPDTPTSTTLTVAAHHENDATARGEGGGKEPTVVSGQSQQRLQSSVQGDGAYDSLNEAVLDRDPAVASTTATAVLRNQDEALVATNVDSVSCMPPSSTTTKLGTLDLILSLIKLRGLGALFQSADITFLASLVFGSFGFGATELFRRSFTMAFFSEESTGGGDGSFEQEVILLLAAALATVITSFAATPFEMLRVRSMGLVESQPWIQVFQDFMKEYGVDWGNNASVATSSPAYLQMKEHELALLPKSIIQDLSSLAPLWGGFAPTLSRELPFAVIKFLCFDVLAKAMTSWINLNVVGEGALPVQVGVGSLGLTISAVAGALAGVAGAIVSHPADLILTYTSVQQRSSTGEAIPALDWKDIVKDLVRRDGGVANLFVGLPVRGTFFFLVIGLQFFLYDYVKNLFQVGSDDLSLILDVFYAVRAGLVGADGGGGS